MHLVVSSASSDIKWHQLASSGIKCYLVASATDILDLIQMIYLIWFDLHYYSGWWVLDFARLKLSQPSKLSFSWSWG